MQLTNLTIKGFKSIRDARLELGKTTVLIGANSSGKSSLIDVFKVISHMRTSSLVEYVGQHGGPDSLLCYGIKQTPAMEFELEFAADDRWSSYYARLAPAAKERLMFLDERIEYLRKGFQQKKVLELSVHEAGQFESQINDWSSDDLTAKTVLWFLRKCGVYHFHDTSESAKIRLSSYKNHGKYLHWRGDNLAAFLFSLSHNRPQHFERIQETIQELAPQFAGFEILPLAENEDNVLLGWREKGSDYVFGPHQISDGLLRFIALATVLLQPAESMPDLIVIDEPELGLHPAAISKLASLIYSLPEEKQVLVATQSVTFVNEFSPDDIRIIERPRDNADYRYYTTVKKPDAEQLVEWLDEYSLGDLWQMNVLGARP